MRDRVGNILLDAHEAKTLADYRDVITRIDEALHLASYEDYTLLISARERIRDSVERITDRVKELTKEYYGK